MLWPMILLFLPKINFIGFRGETAGIRFDDVILMLVAGSLLIDWIGRLDLTVEPLPMVGFVVVGVFCVFGSQL